MKPRARFQQRARAAIANPVLQTALDNNAARRRAVWGPAFASLPDAAALRAQARAIRQHTIANLDSYLAQFIQQVRANGFQVHLAQDAAHASQIALQIAQSHDAALVAKSKSMVTEEITLNRAFEAAGIQVVETDLGEFIVQLRGEKPTHIITPAVHLRRQDVADTFVKHLAMPYTTDVAAMNEAARAKLRGVFLSAQVGVTGVNFGIAESGTLCIVANEGNARMVAALPPVHIAIIGLERLLPRMQDLAVLLPLLPRAATGQKITSYVNLINSPARQGLLDGPHQRHLIILDNGRTRTAASDLQEALLCIRCGACLNACPVYQEIGGQTYDSVYPGPVGSLVSPALFGLESYGHLASASTLCGACKDACPVAIDFPVLLQRVRAQSVDEVPQPRSITWAMRLYAWVMTSPPRYRFAQRLAAWTSRILPRRRAWLPWLPPPLSAWTGTRHFPVFARKSFQKSWVSLPASLPAILPDRKNSPPPSQAVNVPSTLTQPQLVAEFSTQLTALGGEFISCTAAQLPNILTEKLHNLGMDQVLVGEMPDAYLPAGDIERISPHLPHQSPQRESSLARYAAVPAGLTLAAAGLADSGTLVQPGGKGLSRLASLLPAIHFAVLPASTLYTNLAAWLSAGGAQLAAQAPGLVLISGPSRTADIEMSLTIGVHGPRQVVVFCLQDK